MISGSDNKGNGPGQNRAHQAPEHPPERDLWVPPGSDEGALTDMPWPVAARELVSDIATWRVAEMAQYRGLLRAAQSLARFGERLRRFPEKTGERFALLSVSAVLRGEGVWLDPEQIALYRALRIGADDAARDLARASWAMRRLLAGHSGGPLDGVHGFLGRSPVSEVTPVPLADDRPLGDELEALGNHWIAATRGMQDLHPLTRAAFAFTEWRLLGLTPYEEMLEPWVAAMRIGAADLAPFLPLAQGQGQGRLAAGGSIEARIRVFYALIESGSLKALMELDRLAGWQIRAARETADLSGRTPPQLIATLLRLPVVSADLVAETLACSRTNARRNLGLFAERGLIREVTGQDRYRFWTMRP